MINVGYSGEDESLFRKDAVFDAYDKARHYLFGVDVKGGFEGVLAEELKGVREVQHIFRHKPVVAYKLEKTADRLRKDAEDLEDKFNDLRLPLISAQHYFDSLAHQATQREINECQRISIRPDSLRLSSSSGITVLKELAWKVRVYGCKVEEALEKRGLEVEAVTHQSGYSPSLYACAASLEAARRNSFEVVERIVDLLRGK